MIIPPNVRASTTRRSPFAFKRIGRIEPDESATTSHVGREDNPIPGACVIDPPSEDLWVSRARPTFLYVMYIMILWALPMGIVSAIRPTLALDIARGMRAYLNCLPDGLYTLFGTGYLGYATLRQWGKVKGSDR